MLKKFNALCESLKKVFTQKEMSTNFSELIYDKGEYYVLNGQLPHHKWLRLVK